MVEIDWYETHPEFRDRKQWRLIECCQRYLVWAHKTKDNCQLYSICRQQAIKDVAKRKRPKDALEPWMKGFIDPVPLRAVQLYNKAHTANTV